MGNTNCCGIGVGVPFGFEPDKPSSDCPEPHPSQPLPPPHLAHLHQHQLYAQSFPGLPSAYRSHRYHLPYHHSHGSFNGPPRHSLPPASAFSSSAPPPSASAAAEDADSIIMTFQNLRHFPPEIFLAPAPSSSPSSLFLTHISSLDVCYPRVRQLVLDFNFISFVPLEIGLLRNLTELSLAGNCIASLPSSFYSLSSLTALNLGSNLLTHISPSICQLHNLTHLYLPSNRLSSSLPSSLRRCERLQRISLAENRIVFADPAHVSRTAKKTSRTASVSHVQLQQQAYGITPLSHLPPSLTSSLSPFDSSFPLPSSLAFLSLSSCHLTSVPSLLPSSLSSITHLDLSENMLRELPPDFHLLRRLRVLHLSCNDLTELLCPCEVERRRKSKERDEREKKRKEREQKADEERLRERTSRGQAAAPSAAAEEAEDEHVDLNDVLLLTLSPPPDEEEMTELELERDEQRDVTLSSIGSASLTSPRSSSPRHSFSACCFPELTSLYLDNNLFGFPAQPRASSSFAVSASSPSSPPPLSFVSSCFLPFSLRFLNLSGNPILLCKDGIADSAVIRQYALEKEKRDRKLSKQSVDALHHRDDASGAAAPGQLATADLSREERLEVENDRQRRESGGAAPTLETVKAARKRSVSFSAVVGYSSDLAHSRRLQPAASGDQQLDERFRHGHDVSAVLSSLSALQSFHSSLRFEYRYQLPDLVIDGVWLGCWECAKNKQGLQALHVSHVLTVAQFPPLYPHVFVYRQVQVQDVVGEDLLSHLEDAVQWVHERRKEGKRLLIHCRQGISRSATVMIAYCMTYGTGDVAAKDADRERRETTSALDASEQSVYRREEEDDAAAALPTAAIATSSASSSPSSSSQSSSGLPTARSSSSSSASAPRPPLPPPPPVPRGAQPASPLSAASSAPLCMTYEAAFAFVASKRPGICPNEGFRAQLAAYEQLKKDRAAADRGRA